MINIVGLNFDDATEDVVSQHKDRFFDVGIYECFIDSVEVMPNKEGKDPNWAPVHVKVKAEGYSAKSVFLGIPLNTEGFLRYNTSENSARFRRAKLSQFMGAIINKDSFTKAEFAKEIGRLFSKPEKLVGMRLVVEFAHKRQHAYLRYTGTRGQYHLVSPDGVVQLDEEGAPLIFGTPKACEEEATKNGWKFSAFVDANGFSPSAMPNDLKRLGGTTPAVVAGMDEEV